MLHEYDDPFLDSSRYSRNDSSMNGRMACISSDPMFVMSMMTSVPKCALSVEALSWCTFLRILSVLTIAMSPSSTLTASAFGTSRPPLPPFSPANDPDLDPVPRANSSVRGTSACR